MILVHYLLTASLYLLLFYGCYVGLRRNTFFSTNRAYLLASIGLSLVLPFVTLPTAATVIVPIRQITLPAVVVSAQSAAESTVWSMGLVFGLLYGMGVVFRLVRLGLTLRSIVQLIRRGTPEQTNAYVLVRLPNENGTCTSSFSFGRYLVLNHADGLLSPPALLRHEEAHIRQGHTFDVLFVEVVRAFFWFNPVLGFYKAAFQEVHEFLADRAAVEELSTLAAFSDRTGVRPSYAQQVVAYALSVPANTLIAPFSSKSTLKQRILMLQKPLTNHRALVKYVLVVPLVAGLLMCTQPENETPLATSATSSSQTMARQPVKVEGEVFTVVEEQPEFVGGMAQLSKYMQENLRYPAAAQKANIQGRVFASFIVTKTGEITDITILKDIGFGTGEETKRIIAQMPRWVPARQSGEPVNVRYNIPINFQLE